MKAFKLSKKQEELANRFREQHRHMDTYDGSPRGHISFIFSPIGTANKVKVRCSICNVEKDITDYDTW